MKIHVHQHFYLQFKLGMKRFENLLRHLGLLRGQTLWPSHPAWFCPGVPETTNFPAEECCNQLSDGGVCQLIDDDDDDDINDDFIDDPIDYQRNAYMVGAKVGKGVHPQWGIFVCRGSCASKMRCRERDELEQLKNRNQLTDAQADRLEEIYHHSRTAQRNRQKERVGEGKILRRERVRARKNGGKRVRSDEHMEKDRKRPRSSSDRRFLGKKGDIPYPDWLVEWFKHGLLFFCRRYMPGQPVHWSVIVGVFHKILDDHIDDFPDEVKSDGRTTRQNKARTRRPQMSMIASEFLEAPDGVGPNDLQEWSKSRFTLKEEYRVEELEEDDEDGELVKELCEDISAAALQFMPK